MRISFPVLLATSMILFGCQVTVAPPVATPVPAAGGKGTTPTPTTPVSTINFGNDSGPYPFDGECDDPRFQGNGVAADSILNSANQFRDASDCRAMFNSGRATLRAGGGNGFPVIATPSINFGNDSGPYPFDGECDDPRFQGNGVAADSILNSANQFRDASDCRAMFNSGRATLRPGGGSGFPMATAVPPMSSINFGNDSGSFPFDGECDDPRFFGPGMAANASLTSANNFRDATDCRNLFNAGRVQI